MIKIEPKIIVAIDANSREEAYAQVRQLDPRLSHLKIGNVLFTRCGPSLIEELIQKNYRIFLDLKFHDIPKIVAAACREAALLGVWMIDVHISGGRAMLETAVDTLQNMTGMKPLLIGITILTSLDTQDLKAFGINDDISSLVARMAMLAKESGFNGVVCSPNEAALLRKQQGKEFLLVTPGIRLSDDKKNDQKRTMTPEAAIKAGSNYLVIGRSITQSSNPQEVLQKITKLIAFATP